MTDEKQTVPDEYTADDIKAALLEEYGDDDGRAAAAEDTFIRSRGGPGRNPRPSAPIDHDGIPLASKTAHNDKVWGGGDEPPEWFAKAYKHEKYQHRIMAFMKAQGMSNVEIAIKTGYSAQSVSQIMHLPWVVTVIAEEIARSGRDAVQEVLQSSAMDTVQFLIKSRDDEKAQLRDRITCGKELLDRIFGKPNQPITHREEVDLEALTDQQLGQIIQQNSNLPN